METIEERVAAMELSQVAMGEEVAYLKAALTATAGALSACLGLTKAAPF